MQDASQPKGWADMDGDGMGFALAGISRTLIVKAGKPEHLVEEGKS